MVDKETGTKLHRSLLLLKSSQNIGWCQKHLWVHSSVTKDKNVALATQQP